MKEVEVWKPVRGYEGMMEVSNYGNVKMLKRTVSNGTSTRVIQERLLPVRPSKDKYPYAIISFSIDGKNNSLIVGRVVYEAFNDIDLDIKKIVVHKDGNRMNNRLDNIKVMTRRNVRQTRTSKTGFVGVRESTSCEGYYSAVIVFECREITLHSSHSKEECHKIYQLAKAMIDEYDKLKAGILSNSRLNNKLIVKSLPIK
jgi:hypothetical protein